MKIHLTLLIALSASVLCAQNFINVASLYDMDYQYGVGHYGGGVSFVDFDQDGLDDITFATGINQNIAIHRNTGDGFEVVELDGINLPYESKQIIWVDYDNDGDLDLYITLNNLNRLLRQDPGQTFVDISTTCGFTDEVQESFPASWFDYDKDGLLDVLTSHRTGFQPTAITLYRNLGNDQFEDVTSSTFIDGLATSVLATAVLDFDNDGWEDIYIGQDFNAGNLLLRNKANGTFENVSSASMTNVQNNTMTTTIGDYNRDGFMDIYVTNTGAGNTLYQNDGDGTFSDVSAEMNVVFNQFFWGAIFFDADNDMDLDLHVAGQNVQPNPFASYMMENQNAGESFTDVNVMWGFPPDTDASMGCAIGDYNNDGKVDFVRNVDSGNGHTLFLNQLETGNFLSIDLEGVMSNRKGVGAILEVTAGGTAQKLRVGCGEGFLSQNSYTQFFGLGENEVASLIEVSWPSGEVTILENVEANQRISIVELAVGCTNPNSCNYDPTATTDDESCIAPCDCLADLNLDGAVTAQDIVIFLSYMGCVGFPPECLGDINGEGVVNVADLLILLEAFGTYCP